MLKYEHSLESLLPLFVFCLVNSVIMKKQNRISSPICTTMDSKSAVTNYKVRWKQGGIFVAFRLFFCPCICYVYLLFENYISTWANFNLYMIVLILFLFQSLCTVLKKCNQFANMDLTKVVSIRHFVCMEAAPYVNMILKAGVTMAKCGEGRREGGREQWQ